MTSGTKQETTFLHERLMMCATICSVPDVCPRPQVAPGGRLPLPLRWSRAEDIRLRPLLRRQRAAESGVNRALSDQVHGCAGRLCLGNLHDETTSTSARHTPPFGGVVLSSSLSQDTRRRVVVLSSSLAHLFFCGVASDRTYFFFLSLFEKAFSSARQALCVKRIFPGALWFTHTPFSLAAPNSVVVPCFRQLLGLFTRRRGRRRSQEGSWTRAWRRSTSATARCSSLPPGTSMSKGAEKFRFFAAFTSEGLLPTCENVYWYSSMSAFVVSVGLLKTPPAPHSPPWASTPFFVLL